MSSIFRFSIPQTFFSLNQRLREREKEIKIIVSQACFDKLVLKHAQLVMGTINAVLHTKKKKNEEFKSYSTI